MTTATLFKQSPLPISGFPRLPSSFKSNHKAHPIAHGTDKPAIGSPAQQRNTDNKIEKFRSKKVYELLKRAHGNNQRRRNCNNQQGSGHQEKQQRRNKLCSPLQTFRARGKNPSISFREKSAMRTDISAKPSGAPAVGKKRNRNKANHHAYKKSHPRRCGIKSLQRMWPGIEHAGPAPVI